MRGYENDEASQEVRSVEVGDLRRERKPPAFNLLQSQGGGGLSCRGATSEAAQQRTIALIRGSYSEGISL